jgi:predicted nucleotidyltransferase
VQDELVPHRIDGARRHAYESPAAAATGQEELTQAALDQFGVFLREVRIRFAQPTPARHQPAATPAISTIHSAGNAQRNPLPNRTAVAVVMFMAPPSFARMVAPYAQLPQITLFKQNRAMRPSDAIHMHRSRIREIALTHHVRDVRVFGSAARGEDAEDSDLDLLVEPTSETTLFDIGAIRVELKQLLGIEIDVLTPQALPAKFRAQVLREAKPV